MKKNLDRFKLAHVSQLLERELYNQLGILGKGVLSKEILNNQVNLDSYSEVKEVLSLIKEGCSE